MKYRLRLIRVRPIYYQTSDNPNICLGNVDCSFYIHRIALKENFRKKEIEIIAYTPDEFSYLTTLDNLATLSFLENTKNSFLTMLQLIGLLLQ